MKTSNRSLSIERVVRYIEKGTFTFELLIQRVAGPRTRVQYRLRFLQAAHGPLPSRHPSAWPV